MIDPILCEFHSNKNAITENYLNSLLTGTEVSKNEIMELPTKGTREKIQFILHKIQKHY